MGATGVTELSICFLDRGLFDSNSIEQQVFLSI